jgi:hypothetical protein
MQNTSYILFGTHLVFNGLNTELKIFPFALYTSPFVSPGIAKRIFSIDLILPARTMALGSTQPLTEMSTRNLPGSKGRPG